MTNVLFTNFKNKSDMVKFIIVQFWPNHETYIMDDDHGNTRWFTNEEDAQTHIDNELDEGTVAQIVAFDFNFEKIKV